MNRTREQWDAICPRAVAETASPAAVMYLIQDALSDIARLHKQADQLRAEVEALQWDRKVCREEFREFRRTADETERELRAEVEALRKDKARLDAIEQERWDVLSILREARESVDYHKGMQNIWHEAGKQHAAELATLLERIDAALAGKGGGR